MKLQRVLVLGATSAIAQEVLRLLVADGASVYCVGRNELKLGAVLADLRVRARPGQVIEGSVADLLDFDRHASLIAAADSSLGRLDAVLVAHGTLPDQAACEASVGRTMAAIAENATSVVSLLTLAANYFEPLGSGVIAAISSVAGDRGRQSNYVYGSSKGMVSTFMQGLRNRLSARGIAVVTIKPGFVDTPMTDSVARKGLLWSQPRPVAQAIVRAMNRGSSEVYVPWYWFWIMVLLRHVPESVFKRLRL